MGTGPVLEVPDQDGYYRYVVNQTVTNADGTMTISVVPISPIAPVAVVPNPFSSSPNPDPNTAYVQSLYQAALGRVGANSEVSSWLVKMSAGMTDPEVAADFVNSQEHRQDEVVAYYKEFLDRSPDATSGYWVNALMSGASEEAVAEAFLDSPEYQAAHADSTSFVTDLYIDVLGRQGDSSGISSWQAALVAGVSREAIVADFVESSEANDEIVNSFYTAFLHRQPEQGTSVAWNDMLAATNGSATDVEVGILSSTEFDEDATTPLT